jgi:beta-carotene hydroxylase
MRLPKILRHRIDIASVLMVWVVLAFQLLAFFLDWSWLVLFPLIVLARQVNLVEHNHAHSKIFYNRHLNDALGWMCFLSNGVPLEFYEVHHVKNHHRYNNELQDYSSMFGFEGAHYPDRPVSRAYYILSFPLLTICTSLNEILRAPHSRMFRRFVQSVAVITAVSVALVYIDPVGFVVFFLLPWIIIFHGLGMTNYRHHYACEFSTQYNSSNVMFGLPFGLLGFNIGFHVSHHMKPGLHWSQLPVHHASIRKLIPAANYRPARAAEVDDLAAAVEPAVPQAARVVT